VAVQGRGNRAGGNAGLFGKLTLAQRPFPQTILQPISRSDLSLPIR
jgi:hypothetical protein